MLAAAASRLKKVRRADGGTPTKISWKLAKLRMLLLDTRVDTSIERHGSMHLPDNKKKYDVVFLNPPFGIANSVNRTVNPIGDWSRFVDGTKRMDMIFLAHSLDRLNVKGSMAAIMPNIFLSGQGLVKELRRKLVEGNLLEAVVTLPPRIFSNTGVLTAILFLNKRKETKDIFMLNASELVYKKGQQFYFEGEKAIELFHQRDNLIATQKDDRIRFVTNEEIAAHDYDLQFSSYKRKQDTFLENIEPSSILMQECTQLEEELGEVRMRLAQLIATHIN
jgi:type I restriction enzyme M protein